MDEKVVYVIMLNETEFGSKKCVQTGSQTTGPIFILYFLFCPASIEYSLKDWFVIS
jgi:hypothetical protein